MESLKVAVINGIRFLLVVLFKLIVLKLGSGYPVLWAQTSPTRVPLVPPSKFLVERDISTELASLVGSISIAFHCGIPQIAYYDQSITPIENEIFTKAIKYPIWDPAPGHGVWKIKTIETTAAGSFRTSIALNEQGYPNISYCWGDRYIENNSYNSSSYVKYAKWSGTPAAGTWDIKTVEGGEWPHNAGKHLSMCLDSSGFPNMVYMVDNPPGVSWQTIVRYARWNGSNWQIETMHVFDPSYISGPYMAFSLDSNDIPHVMVLIHRSNMNFTIEYFKKVNDEWLSETVDTLPAYLHGPSIDVDALGNPHLSFIHYGGDAHIKYAKKQSGNWVTEVVDEFGSGGWTSIGIDSGNNPHLFYNRLSDAEDTENNPEGLFYAWRSNSGWKGELLDEKLSWVGDMFIDINDNPHFAYNHRGNLIYANFHRNYAETCVPPKSPARIPPIIIIIVGGTIVVIIIIWRWIWYRKRSSIPR